MAFELKPLPYARDALEPVISAKTLEFHHGKHHKAYIDKTNKLVMGTPFESRPLEEIIKATQGDAAKKELFNNAAQSWNHDFLWRSMKKGGGGKPPGALEKRIAAAFHSIEEFKHVFIEAGMGQFGSGYVWLVEENSKLKVIKTGNAHNPLEQNLKPLLACDVWEHAYYLDYQNRRPDFLKAFADQLINWEFVEENMN